jgi:hypothetical protein
VSLRQRLAVVADDQRQVRVRGDPLGAKGLEQ